MNHLLRLEDPRALALADQLLVSFGTFVVTLVAARSLSTTDFSTLTLTLLISMLMANIHRAAVTQPANVLGATEKAPAAQVRLARTLTLSSALAVMSVAVFVAVGAVVGLAALDMLLGWLVFAVFSYQDTLRRHAYTRHDLRVALTLSTLAQLFLFGGLGLLHIAGWASKESFLVVMASSSGVAAAWGAWRLEARPQWHLSAAQAVWSENRPIATWLLLTVAAVWGASQLYMFLGAALGPLAVAYLAASRNILNALHVLSQTLANYIPSRVAICLAEEGVPGVKRFLYRNLLTTAALASVFLLAIFLAAEPLLHLLYGESFVAAAAVLCILAVGYVMSLFGTVLGTFCFGLGDSRSGLVANLTGVVFTLSAGLWMTMNHGLEGLAWALTVSLSVIAASQGCFLVKTLRTASERFSQPARHGV